jgi:uncharacterized protein DUF397
MKAIADQYPRLNWRKSSFSAWIGDCVEVAQFSSLLLVRDSKNPSGPVLWLTQGQWRTLMRRVRAGVAVCEPVFA